MSVSAWRINQTPFAVVDVETTGVNPGMDRIVEISVIRLSPQSTRPEIALDTLINPRRPATLTEVHGITQEDVADAPPIDDVAALIVEALAGAVVVAHNANFEMRFLAGELRRFGIDFDPPHLCTMLLRPLLRLGAPLSLEQQCHQSGIRTGNGPHVASVDTTATAFIMLRYRQQFEDEGIATFADLAARDIDNKYRFTSSFSHPPLPAAVAAGLPRCGATKSRADPHAVAVFGTGSHVAVRREDYLSALFNVLADLEVTEDERSYLQRIRTEQKLSDAQVRAAHVRVLTWVMTTLAQDDVVEDSERLYLARLHGLLRELGWAPGD